MNTTEITEIEKLIFSYSHAFNSANLPNTVSLYADNGILMPNNAPSATGPEQLKAVFEFLFKNFKIDVSYIIDEVIISGDYAFVRTNSKVNTIVNATNEQITLENKELFVLHKTNGGWKIYRYIFNNTKTIK